MTLSALAHLLQCLPASLMVASLLSFKDVQQTSFPSSHLGGEAARQHFLKLLLQQIRDSQVFEGPDRSKNLALDPQGTNPELISLLFFYPQKLTQNPPSSYCLRTCPCTALREDLYYDVGCLLALCLVHRGPPISFFSPALYQCLFNYPANQPLALGHMTPSTHLTCQVNKVGSTWMDG